MSLDAVFHLQAMLYCAQECVSIRKLRSFTISDQRFVRQALQANQGLRNPQPWLAAAVCELKCLHDEFDLADSSATELYIIPIASGVLLLKMIDLVFRDADVAQGFRERL